MAIFGAPTPELLNLIVEWNVQKICESWSKSQENPEQTPVDETYQEIYNLFYKTMKFWNNSFDYELYKDLVKAKIWWFHLIR